jgi:hypothetical protein
MGFFSADGMSLRSGTFLQLVEVTESTWNWDWAAQCAPWKFHL